MNPVDQLLILAPRGRDAQVISAQLQDTHAEPMIATAAQIVTATRAGILGAAVITDEAMAEFDLAALREALGAQPPWSDPPFLVLTRREFGGWTRARLADLLGNVTILERPLHSDVLISSVRSALRARTRQHRAQAHILAREAAEAQVRELAASLESRVHERTEALSQALVERDETQRQLSDSEALYRYTVELTGQTPWTADAAGKLRAVGPGWASIRTVDRDWSRVHPEDIDASSTAWAAAVAASAPFLTEFRLRRPDGSFGWCRSRAAPRRAADGSVTSWYGTLEDIDEGRLAEAKLREFQAELIHVSRLSAMGTMASTLAHELNQPLTAIANYVRGSRRMIEAHGEHQAIRDALEAADRNVVRAGEIVRRVRELVSKGEVQRRPEDLSALVHEACSLAMIDSLTSGINLRLDLAVAPISVMVDRIQIQQVLLNLLRNAADAVAGSPRRRISVTTSAANSLGCEVAVRDSGPGLAPAAAPRLFQPFNTTKGNGMGIGLSISRAIIEAHGGSIWHRQAPDGGAIFAFSLISAQREGQAAG